MDRSNKFPAKLIPKSRSAIQAAATDTPMFAQLQSESVFARPLDILVDEGYISQSSSIEKETDTRLYQDVCTLCDLVVWEYAGHFHESSPTQIAEWFSANSPKYHVSTKCAAHFYEVHPDELALATLKASI